MDQEAFRSTYREINECFCLYEKGILTHRCACPLAQRFCIAEREGVECQSPEAQAQCAEFLACLQLKARFLFKSRGHPSPLPHGKALRLQVGGLRGLHRLRHPNQATPVLIANVHGLLNDCLRHYGTIEQLPYQEIIHEVAAYQEPRRMTRRRRDREDE